MEVAEEPANRSQLQLFTDPEFAALAAVNFTNGLTLATVVIALALYADLFAASGVIASLFMGAYATIRLLLVLPIGRYIDIGDSKRVLLVGLLLNSLMILGFALVQTVEHVILLRAVQGVASMILLIAGTTIIGEIALDGETGRWIGTFNQTFAFSGLTGDLVGGALLYLYGFGLTYAVLLVVSVAATLAVIWFVRDDPGERADPDDSTGLITIRKLLTRSAIRALVAFRFSFSFSKMAVILFLPIYARTEFGMSAFAIGGILAGGRVTMSLTQGYVGRVSDRVGGLEWFVFAGTVVYAVGIALIPLASYATARLEPVILTGFGHQITVSPAFFVLFVSYLLLGVGDSLRLPTSLSLFVREGEYFDAVAGSLSLRSVSWQTGALIGPLAVGAIVDLGSYRIAFWLAAVVAFLAGLAFLFLYADEPEPASPR